MANNLGLAVKPVTETPVEEVERVAAWINTEEYKEKNFARTSLVINPAHACQPLGAELAAHGFEGSLPFVHGSQGCASYYRSTLNRHFREPAPAVSDAMTEDGAVFGGQNNLHEALENAHKIYKPKIMPIFTSCMPEIIGDDLTAFIKNAKNKQCVPADFPLPYANTPSFNGSHIHGYDAMLVSILQTLTAGKQVEGRCTGKLNLIAGFDANTGNYREYKRILKAFGKPVPESLKAERGNAVDAMTDAHQYMHGKKFAIYGDPDYLMGYISFLLEMGAKPYHILCSKGTKKVEKEIQALLDTSPDGKEGKIYINKDLWHMR